MLGRYGSVAPMGTQERIANVVEVVGRDIDGQALKAPRTITRPGLVEVSLYRLDPPRMPVPQD